jgi:hypothetical protein
VKKELNMKNLIEADPDSGHQGDYVGPGIFVALFFVSVVVGLVGSFLTWAIFWP